MGFPNSRQRQHIPNFRTCRCTAVGRASTNADRCREAGIARAPLPIPPANRARSTRSRSFRSDALCVCTRSPAARPVGAIASGRTDESGEFVPGPAARRLRLACRVSRTPGPGPPTAATPAADRRTAMPPPPRRTPEPRTRPAARGTGSAPRSPAPDPSEPPRPSCPPLSLSPPHTIAPPRGPRRRGGRGVLRGGRRGVGRGRRSRWCARRRRRGRRRKNRRRGRGDSPRG